MLDWLHKLTMPRSAHAETAHREFVLKAVVVSAIVLLGLYILLDWVIIVSTRRAFAFSNVFNAYEGQFVSVAGMKSLYSSCYLLLNIIIIMIIEQYYN